MISEHSQKRKKGDNMLMKVPLEQRRRSGRDGGMSGGEKSREGVHGYFHPSLIRRSASVTLQPSRPFAFFHPEPVWATGETDDKRK